MPSSSRAGTPTSPIPKATTGKSPGRPTPTRSLRRPAAPPASPPETPPLRCRMHAGGADTPPAAAARPAKGRFSDQIGGSLRTPSGDRAPRAPRSRGGTPKNPRDRPTKPRNDGPPPSVTRHAHPAAGTTSTAVPPVAGLVYVLPIVVAANLGAAVRAGHMPPVPASYWQVTIASV